MDFKTHQHRLASLSGRFNLMVLLVFGLLLTNVVLGGLLYYTTWHQKIEVTPFFEGQGYTKSNAAVDTHYLQMMSENFIYTRLNVTPETVAARHKSILEYLDSAHYEEIEKQLLAEKTLIQSLNVSSEYLIESIDVNPSSLQVKVKGVLKRFVGFQALSEEKRTYLIAYRYSLGHLSIERFLQVEEDKNEK